MKKPAQLKLMWSHLKAGSTVKVRDRKLNMWGELYIYWRGGRYWLGCCHFGSSAAKPKFRNLVWFVNHWFDYRYKDITQENWGIE